MKYRVRKLVLLTASIVIALWGQAAAHAQFVTQKGMHLFVGSHQIRLYGGTLYLTYDGKSYLTGGAFASRKREPTVDRYLTKWTKAASVCHMNVLRVTDWLPATSKWNNPEIYRQLDFLANLDSKHHIYTEIDLSAYRNWLITQKRDPYDPANWRSFIHFIGVHFRNNQNIAMYGIAGEVPAPNYSKSNPTASKLLDFFRVVSTELHKADPNHLISSGGFIFMDDSHSGIPWRRIFSLPNIHIASIHAYAGSETGVASAAYRNVGPWANMHDVPFVVEEFGYHQRVGDGVRAGLFESNYKYGKLYHAAGMIFWNWGGETMKNDGSQTAMDVNPDTLLTYFTVLQNCASRTLTVAKASNSTK